MQNGYRKAIWSATQNDEHKNKRYSNSSLFKTTYKRYCINKTNHSIFYTPLACSGTKSLK